MRRKLLLCWKAYLPRSSWPTRPMTPITCAKPSLPKARLPSSPTTHHGHSNIRSTSISIPSAISWSAASQNSSNSAASRPASKRPPEITGRSSLSQPSFYGCDKCPHRLDHMRRREPAGPGARLDLKRGVVNAKAVRKLLTDDMEKHIVVAAGTHEMCRQGRLIRAHRPDVQIMHLLHTVE